MKAKAFFSIAALTTSAMSFAESYQAEIGVRANREVDNFHDTTEHSHEAVGRYFFKPVETNNLPFAEAAYLGKATNVFARVYDMPKHDLYLAIRSYSLGAEVYVPENFLYASVVGRRSSVDGDSENDFTTILGVTPIDGLRVTTLFNNRIDYRANIQGKYVTNLGDNHFLNIEAAYYDEKVFEVMSVGGDYYFDRSFSVGGEITDTNGEKSYEFRLRKFFSPKFSADLAYIDDSWGNTISAGVSVRF